MMQSRISMPKPVGPPKAVRPRTEDVREIISVKALLEWAFATECASLEADEVAESSGGQRRAVGTEYRIFEMMSLAARPGELVRVDISPGRSFPADDAELVATVLRNAVDWGLAIEIASHARACSAPKWDLGQQRLEPKAWSKRNHLGVHGKTEVVEVIKYRQRGRLRERRVEWVPCVWTPDAAQIGRARRAYLDWWRGLATVRADLKAVRLDRWWVSDRMPPMEPWRERA